MFWDADTLLDGKRRLIFPSQQLMDIRFTSDDSISCRKKYHIISKQHVLWVKSQFLNGSPSHSYGTSTPQLIVAEPMVHGT